MNSACNCSPCSSLKGAGGHLSRDPPQSMRQAPCRRRFCQVSQPRRHFEAPQRRRALRASAWLLYTKTSRQCTRSPMAAIKADGRRYLLLFHTSAHIGRNLCVFHASQKLESQVRGASIAGCDAPTEIFGVRGRRDSVRARGNAQMPRKISETAIERRRMSREGEASST